MDYLICYDICDPSRLGRVHRCLQKSAMPIQYSVFMFVGSHKAMTHCIAAVQELIDPEVDDLRCYPLPTRGRRDRLGLPALPEGIQWSGLPIEKLKIL